MGLGQYKLNGHTPELVTDLLEWGKWMQTANRRVAREDFPDGVYVSTVFLGLDHSFGRGDPILFETMVFGGPLDMEMERYRTWDEAGRGHSAMVERVKATPKPNDAIAES